MRMIAGYMEKPNGFSNVQVAPCRGHTSLPPKGPSQAAVLCGSIQADKQVDMPRSSSTNVLTEEQPSWLEDLLNEPETPTNKGHRRSASDSFAYCNASSTSRPQDLWLRSIVGGPSGAWGYQMPPHFKGQAATNRKPSSTHELHRDNLWKSSSSSPPPLPNGVTSSSTKEDADFKALDSSCSPPKPDTVTLPGNETQNQGDAASHTSENSSGGSDCAQMKPSVPPPASKTDVKRKQHNARRSRVRKLQYIAELERNVQALQVEGAEVSAQLEFLDQQNLLLGMENRALKQRLESLSQEQLIKSMEQEILDRELGRLQYLYHLQNLNHQQRQRQKQNPGAHRRGRSCDIDSQLAKLSLNPPEAIVTSNGFKDFPHRN